MDNLNKMIFLSKLFNNKTLRLIFFYCIIFLSFDFFLGQSLIDFLYKKNFLSNPNLIIETINNEEKKYRIKHDYFHHTLKENVEVVSRWGPFIYKTCTDQNGFRVVCDRLNQTANKKNIVLIGDSYTEGLGLNYEKTFAGMLSKSSNENIINMAVSSYSPLIYKKKIEYYLSKGIKIDQLFIFVDTSDIIDETRYYLCGNNSVCTGEELSINNTDNVKNTKKVNFPMWKKIKRSIRLIKRKFLPKIHVYEKDFERSSWPYLKSNDKIEKGIKNSLKNMNELFHYLKKRNIPISLVVYPYPGQILYDQENSKQVRIWEKFCKSKCENFIDLFPIFFKEIKNNKRKAVVKKFYLKNDLHFNELGNKKIFNHLIGLELF